MRALAFGRIRALGDTSPRGILLGTIVEVPLADGLDVLAAFSDGGVRYLSHSGKILIFEGETPVTQLAKELLSMSKPVVDKIGPWEKVRLPPPSVGNVRISFLVSDGLYFGEGPLSVFRHDEMAGPLLAKATELLQKAVETGLE